MSKKLPTDLFMFLSGIALDHIMTTVNTPEHSSSSGKKLIFADCLYPGLGHHLAQKKNAKYIMIGYGCCLLFDLIMAATIILIPVSLLIELAFRAVSLKALTAKRVCEHCNHRSPYNALYCSNCHESFIEKKILCPHCRKLTTDGADFCENCEANITDHQRIKLCSECNNENDKDAQYCAVCGSFLAIEHAYSNCPKCNYELKPGDIFCSKCGTNLIESDETSRNNIYQKKQTLNQNNFGN